MSHVIPSTIVSKCRKAITLTQEHVSVGIVLIRTVRFSPGITTLFLLLF